MKLITCLKLFTLFTLIIFTACKKDSVSNSSNSNVVDEIGTGKFTIAGKVYTGTCVATSSSAIGNNGVDVGIVTTNGDAFAIGNLSTANSGSVAFSDGWSQPVGTTFGVVSISASSILMGTKAGGTITKTGLKSFTFSCTVYDILSTSQYIITGSGNYK